MAPPAGNNVHESAVPTIAENWP